MPRKPGPPEPAPELRELLEAGIPRGRAVLGVRIGQLRVASGWTYHTLGQQAGMSATNLMRLEWCKVNSKLETLTRLAKVLGLASVEQLFGALPSEDLVNESAPSDVGGPAGRQRQGRHA